MYPFKSKKEKKKTKRTQSSNSENKSAAKNKDNGTGLNVFSKTVQNNKKQHEDFMRFLEDFNKGIKTNILKEGGE